MKKLFLILSILLALLTIGQAKAQGLTGSGTTDDPYLISSNADWTSFAQSVTNDTTYAGQTVKLTADITATVMAGSHTDETNYHAFSGTFDGDGHTITLALSGSGQGTALFSDLNGATLKNLKAQGTVSTDDRRPATFAVIVFGNSTISNCWSTVAVSSTRTSDWVDGGGFVSRVSSNATLNMTDCAFHGSVTFAPGATTGGGMIGYTQNNATVNLTDCLYSPSALTLNVSQYNPRVFVSGEVSGNLNNCYYNAVAANSVLENQGIDASGMTDAALAAALGEGWHVYNDMVVPFTGKYYISSAAEWNAFATTVNNGTSYSGQIVALTTDIPTAVTMMAGTESNPFCGTFDGDGHTITLALSGSGQGTALFYLIEGATLKNLKVQGTVTTSGYRPATFTAFVEGNCTISNCWSTVAVSSTKTNSWVDGGGFVGRVSSNATLNMTGCAFHGSVTFDSTATTGGGMVGFTQTNAVVNLTNCLYSPTELTLNVSQYYPRIFVSGYVPGNLNNCYYNAVAANSALENQGKLMHSIAGDANVTVAFDGEATAYDLSGISAYSVGMVYDSTLYAGQGETVSLNLGCTPPPGYTFNGFSASAGTLTGTASPYTLTMPDEDVTIQAVLELLSSVDYINGEGETQTCSDFTILTGNETTLEAGWYVVISDIFYDSTLTLNGDVNLILCDSTTMTISNSTNPSSYAINAEGDLTIYGQSGGTGTLSAPFSTYIGLYTNEGNVEINGGIVTLCGYYMGIFTNGGDVIIRGGVVTVTGNGSYGIFSRPGNVFISGGTVTSIGNANSISCQNVNISGGKVTATGNGAFGIDCSNFIISGGEVTTLGGAYGINSAGDGSTNGNITIGGGKVTATGSGVSGIYGFNIIITGGEVTATTGSGNGSYGISGYNVIISDGIVMARGNRSGIGSGTNSTDGSLTISGGTVTATGSGYGIIGSNVIINGGEVTANGIGYGIFGFDIIISDGEVTANATGSCIGLGDNSTKGSLTISGGTVTAIGASESIFVYGDVDISGGTVTATGNNMGIYCSGDVNISGGIVAANGNYVNGIYSTNGSITISGGKVSASGYHNGISVSDDITLGWTNTDDYISANGYNATNGIVAVRSGQALYYEDDGGENVIVSGILDEDQIDAIGGKTLRPHFVNYMDGDGEMHYCSDYTVLTGEETTLTEGWYVVDSDLTYNSTLTLNGDVNLILCNGKTMTVTTYSGYSIDGDTLTIFGQSLDTVVAGTLNVTNNVEDYSIYLWNYIQHSGNVVANNPDYVVLVASNITIYGGSINANCGYCGIYAYNIIINGGNINAKGRDLYAIRARDVMTINGGSIHANGGEYCIYVDDIMTINGGNIKAINENHGIWVNADFTINGGKLEASKIWTTWGNLTLGWTSTDDYIHANYNVEGITVKSGQAFYYDNNVIVCGTLNNSQIHALSGKTLRPYIVPTTVTKDISGYGTGDGGWQLIALPLQGTISPTTIDNLIADTAVHYDLYRFEPSHEGNEWENYKASDTFKLETGKGYLYANADNVTLTFSGPSYIGDNCEIALVYDANDEQKCWNLVGNPFDFNATLDREYYVLDENGLDINPEPIPATTPVPPCTAVFVKAVEEGDAVVFTRVTQ